MSSIKIFVSHRIDQNNIVFKNDIYTPIRCGAVYDDKEINDVLGDDTGINISDKRPFLGEFTVQYWAWKNVDADYYGLCHYRRYLSFSDTEYPTDEKNQVVEKRLSDASFEKYNLNNTEYINAEVSKYDAVVAEYADISKMYTPKGARPTLYEHFAAYDNHLICKDDIDLFLHTIGELYPNLKNIAVEYFNGSKFRGYNCFILKKELFYQLCEMEVSILRELERTKKINFEHRSELQARTYGFFTEWIYGIFIYYLEKQNKKIKYNQLVFFEVTEKPEYIEPQDGKIPIVLGTNPQFLPATLVTLQSIIDSTDNPTQYEFLICHFDISIDEQKNLNKYYEHTHGIKITFINLKNTLVQCSTGTCWDSLKNPASFLIVLPWILKNYKKVIYLHSDVIVTSNISDLFQLELNGNYIAAPRDYLRISEHRRHNKKYAYRKHVLSMDNPYDYISSNTLLMDLEKIRTSINLDDCVRNSMRNMYYMDAMNRLFYGNIYFLDSIWNSFVISNQYTQLLSEYIPQNFSDNWKKAQKSPKIIHFQSNPKPWNDPKIIKADLFWSIARKTPYYERLIANITPPQIQNIISPQSQERKLVKFLKRILPKWMHPFARKVKRMLGW